MVTIAMPDAPGPDDVHVHITEHDNVDSVVLAFRMDGELYELAELSPGVEATLRKL